MMRGASRGVRSLLRRFGFDAVRYSADRFFHLRRIEVIRATGVSVVVDVGANDGQYTRRLRADGYTGRVVSFEPLPRAFSELARHVAADEAWDCHRIALSEEDGSATINVSANSWSSSLLPMSDRHLESAPDSVYVAAERVPTARLDTLWPELVGEGESAYLKLDVQGLELAVLRGAGSHLRQVQAVESELSLTSLYEGQPLFPDVVRFLEDAGFDLVALERGFSHPSTGKILQLDGLFVRRAAT